MATTRARAFLTGSAVMLAAALLAAPWPGASAAPVAPAAQSAPQTVNIYRVPVRSTQDGTLLAAKGFDLLERREGNDLFVMGDNSVADRLRGFGFAPSLDRTVTAPKWAPPRAADDPAGRKAGDTYYGGYHTVNAQFAHLDDVAKNHADLASAVTYGQSWRKANNKPNGYDLKAICLTKKQQGDCDQKPDSKKPRFFLMGQIHAREIATGDTAYRWIDYLVDNYGKDDRVTKLMDSTEMWVVPIANPDGVDIVQQGGDNPQMQRKNADSSNKDCGGTDTGVDLNRNTNSHWGVSGSTTDPCGETYQGPKADSDENAALEKLFSQLWPDKRGDGDGTAAPADTRGMFISMHSDAGMVLFPWEFDANTHTGNDAALRKMGKDMGGLTKYPSGQAGEILYNASGGTDDWTYDKLGVASFTIEIGDYPGDCSGFFPAYSCEQQHVWPALQPALLYAAEHAAAPYQTS